MPQPEPKRKTLAERAGEPIKSQIPSATLGLARPTNGVKGSSIAALSKPPVTASRHAPTNSFAKSVGPGARPPPTGRAPTSMGFAQSTNGRPRGLTRTRPATSMGNREREEEAVPANQQKGMKGFPSSQQHHLTLQPNKPPKPVRPQAAASHTRKESKDMSGLDKRLENLSLHDKSDSSGGQVVSEQSGQSPSSSS